MRKGYFRCSKGMVLCSNNYPVRTFDLGQTIVRPRSKVRFTLIESYKNNALNPR